MRLALTRIAAPPKVPHHHFLRPQSAADPADAPGLATGLYAGEPAHCRRSIRRFLPVMLQLGLLVAVAEVYHLGRAFELLMLVAAAGLPLHYLLPFRWKKPAFLAISIVGLGWVFGGPTLAVILPASAAIIGVCLSRLPWIAKAGAALAAAVGLALVRAGVVALDLPAPVLPVLGTMFMFRLIIFLYELKHAKKREPVIDAVGYFFLLPNYCFLHFPVVDYRTLQRSFFVDEVHATQRAGLRMMLNGFVHLLLYRYLDHRWQIAPSEVGGPGTLAWFLAWNYLLYLHVSGQFHVACGMLHLYGYKLPETHHRYLLATGFTDYWRRINIYWKDFMVRVFFNPVAFRLKRRPQWQALAAATAVVFAATWFLHGYQMFWLEGRWGFSPQDALFWGSLGVLVLVNVQLDARRGPPRSRSKCAEAAPWRACLVRSVKVAGTLATTMLLWSLWTSPSVSEWLAMLRRGLGVA